MDILIQENAFENTVCEMAVILSWSQCVNTRVTFEGHPRQLIQIHICHQSNVPDNTVHGANMGPTWVLSAPDGPHVGPMNLAIRGVLLPPHSSVPSKDAGQKLMFFNVFLKWKLFTIHYFVPTTCASLSLLNSSKYIWYRSSKAFNEHMRNQWVNDTFF